MTYVPGFLPLDGFLCTGVWVEAGILAPLCEHPLVRGDRRDARSLDSFHQLRFLGAYLERLVPQFCQWGLLC